MTKQEFLEAMRLALNGKVAPGQVMENLRFYEDYINTETRKGSSEEEVLARLGDPRLLARTIVETRGGGNGQFADVEYDGDNGAWQWQDAAESGKYEPYGTSKQGRRHLPVRLPVWVWLVAVILIVVLIISAVFSILVAILPVLLPVLLVLLAVKLFRDWVR